MAPQICDQRRSQIRKERKVGFAVCNVHIYTCGGGGGVTLFGFFSNAQCRLLSHVKPWVSTQCVRKK